MILYTETVQTVVHPIGKGVVIKNADNSGAIIKILESLDAKYIGFKGYWHRVSVRPTSLEASQGVAFMGLDEAGRKVYDSSLWTGRGKKFNTPGF